MEFLKKIKKKILNEIIYRSTCHFASTKFIND